MSDEDETTINTKGLDKLIKAFSGDIPTARIGILGDKTLRTSKSGASNAEIGAAHEYGTAHLPQRSFLRLPLSEQLNKQLESSGALDKEVLKDVIRSGSIVPWLTKTAILAEAIVIGAFGTNGYGKWPPWKNPNYKNNTGNILVDTQQLRNSITYEVKE